MPSCTALNQDETEIKLHLGCWICVIWVHISLQRWEYDIRVWVFFRNRRKLLGPCKAWIGCVPTLSNSLTILRITPVQHRKEHEANSPRQYGCQCYCFAWDWLSWMSKPSKDEKRLTPRFPKMAPDAPSKTASHAMMVLRPSGSTISERTGHTVPP